MGSVLGDSLCWVLRCSSEEEKKAWLQALLGQMGAVEGQSAPLYGPCEVEWCTIPHTRTARDGPNGEVYTRYQVHVHTSDGSTWKVERRFKAFQALSKAVGRGGTRKGPLGKPPQAPSSFTLRSSLSEGVVTKRRAELESFLQRLLVWASPCRGGPPYRSLLHFLDAFGDPEAVTPSPTPRPSEEHPAAADPESSSPVAGLGQGGSDRLTVCLASIDEVEEAESFPQHDEEGAEPKALEGGWHGADPVRLSEMLQGENEWLRCFTPYDAEEPEELSIQAGESIRLIRNEELGWSFGEQAGGRLGYFPTAFCERHEPTDPAALALETLGWGERAPRTSGTPRSSGRLGDRLSGRGFSGELTPEEAEGRLSLRLSDSYLRNDVTPEAVKKLCRRGRLSDCSTDTSSVSSPFAWL